MDITIEYKIRELYEKIEAIPAEKWQKSIGEGTDNSMPDHILRYSYLRYSVEGIILEQRRFLNEGCTSKAYLLKIDQFPQEELLKELVMSKRNEILFDSIVEKYSKYDLERSNKAYHEEQAELAKQIDAVIERISKIK